MTGSPPPAPRLLERRSCDGAHIDSVALGDFREELKRTRRGLAQNRSSVQPRWQRRSSTSAAASSFMLARGPSLLGTRESHVYTTVTRCQPWRDMTRDEVSTLVEIAPARLVGSRAGGAERPSLLRN